jgi:hypothetical protein
MCEKFFLAMVCLAVAASVTGVADAGQTTARGNPLVRVVFGSRSIDLYTASVRVNAIAARAVGVISMVQS